MNPICLCGFTVDGKQVLGGAFQMADTMGFPLTFSMEEAEKRHSVVSLPHYFASAMERGWDDDQTFGAIREALEDHGRNSKEEMHRIRLMCIAMFMEFAHTMPGANAMEIGKAMREKVEKDGLATLATSGLVKR